MGGFDVESVAWLHEGFAGVQVLLRGDVAIPKGEVGSDCAEGEDEQGVLAGAVEVE